MNTPTNLLLTAIASLAFVLPGCSTSDGAESILSESNGPSRAYLSARNLPSHGVALEGYCPVAYFAVNEPVRGLAEYAADHAGVTYYFVSEEARQEFLGNPEKYIPAYGGWCAFGMAVEDKFPVDPTNFKIVNGRLNLFLRNAGVDALQLWNDGDETKLLSQAASHWEKVQG